MVVATHPEEGWDSVRTSRWAILSASLTIFPCRVGLHISERGLILAL
jgi:hypothetical protein